MSEERLREALREAYTLLVSAEPTLIRDARAAPNETSAHYKALLRDRVAEWLAPYREHFDEGAAALAATPTQTGAEGPTPEQLAAAIWDTSDAAEERPFVEATDDQRSTAIDWAVEILAALRSGAEVAAAPGLDAAWDEAIAATPEGWFSPAVEKRAFGRWRAWFRAVEGNDTMGAWGDTESDALHSLALAARLTDNR